MLNKNTAFRVIIGITCTQVLLNLGLFHRPQAPTYLAPWLSAIARADEHDALGEGFLDFEEEDIPDLEENGFNAIYIDQQGDVLGTFVNVPGAKIQVYASGRIEIEERDYTTEFTYYTNGRLRTIGDARFTYYTDGRIRTIDDIRFTYYSDGRLREIGDVRFRYRSNGRLREIDDVSFDYETNGLIEQISDNETNNGIRIVIVD